MSSIEPLNETTSSQEIASSCKNVKELFSDDNEAQNVVHKEEEEKEEEDDGDQHEKEETKKSKYKFGIIYLSRIPQGRNYTRLREIFTRYGEVGNIYLVPDKYANERVEKKGKLFKCYAEGFVEFKKKKVAKMVAELLNGQPIEKSKNGIKGFIWDIRYLHRVKWHHLMAKLKHTKALEEQKIRFETEQAKESAEHYLEMVQEWKRREKQQNFVSSDSAKRTEFLINKQRPTKKEILQVKQKMQKNREDESLNKLYDSLFS